MVTYKWLSLNETITKAVTADELNEIKQYEREGRLKIIEYIGSEDNK